MNKKISLELKKSKDKSKSILRPMKMETQQSKTYEMQPKQF